MKTITSNIVSENIFKIKELFPNCVIETKGENGNTTLKIDFETLKQELSDDVIKNNEKYEFTWPGKSKSILLANQPTDKILRPCKDESVNWDTTQNLYIEGDNLEVLKILRSTYFNKVKLIYIDPPYNTGKDFIYKDNYKKTVKEYLRETNQVDKNGKILVQNKETNGRFHTDWLNMMYPRLKLARDFLTDDGVIFISIDRNEVCNLQKLCDEIFGKENFVAICPRKTTEHITVLADYKLQNLNDYVIVYCKNLNKVRINKKITGEIRYEYEDEKGKYTLKAFQNYGESGTRRACPNLYYPIYYNEQSQKLSLLPDLNSMEILPRKVKSEDGRWLWSREKFERDNESLEYKNGTLYRKVYYNPEEDQSKYESYKTWLDMYPNRLGAKALKDLNIGEYFDYSKPVELIKLFIKMSTNEYDITLDFFSGSATTAHAVMQLNAEDGGNRKFIMVQLPEPCDEKSIAFKEGYKNICEIGKERIRRAGKKIIEKTGKTDLDVGFKVLKLDSSNR